MRKTNFLRGRHHRASTLQGLATALLLAFGSSAAFAVDLLNPGDTATINGGIFTVFGETVSGTGLIDSFVRVQANGSEEGVNTDGAFQYDEKAGAFTHSLQLSDIQTNIVNILGTTYYEFVLDINQTTPGSLLDLHEVQIYLADSTDGGTSNLLESDGLVVGNLVYDMDAGSDTEVGLDYNNFPGSGRLDMTLLVPTLNFAGLMDNGTVAGGADGDQYVYLYSAFNNTSNDGFEEWATKLEGTFTPGCTQEPCGGPPGNVPEPATLLLLGVALPMVGAVRRRRHNS